MEIRQNRMERSFAAHQIEYQTKALEVLASGKYILGEEVEAFEREFAAYNHAKYCVGLASGLDSLQLAVRTLGIGAGDEVLVQGNTFIASVMGISMNGATPVFVEPDEFYTIDASKLEAKITDKTKAIMVVHLFGQISDMCTIMDIAHKYHLKVVEDCAQAHGAELNGTKAGHFGDIGCFSFYPSKNCGGFGDGGAIITDHEEYARRIRMLRNYGSEVRYYNEEVGINSRLDELQAALLRIKLKYLDDANEQRRQICIRYLEHIDNEYIKLPSVRENHKTVWHQFVIRCKCRDALMDYLNAYGIDTIIHYPVPPHLSEAYAYLNLKEGSLPVTEQYAREVLSLPLYEGMTSEETDHVIETLNRFKNES